ncbi:MAG: hypothetical protein HOC43_04715 [Planctomycetes bacterium]|jgi:hypothetical protein|nr:hypothetical protein [Planctomycetota bacterium]
MDKLFITIGFFGGIFLAMKYHGNQKIAIGHPSDAWERAKAGVTIKAVFIWLACWVALSIIANS